MCITWCCDGFVKNNTTLWLIYCEWFVVIDLLWFICCEWFVVIDSCRRWTSSRARRCTWRRHMRRWRSHACWSRRAPTSSAMTRTWARRYISHAWSATWKSPRCWSRPERSRTDRSPCKRSGWSEGQGQSKWQGHCAKGQVACQGQRVKVRVNDRVTGLMVRLCKRFRG